MIKEKRIIGAKYLTLACDKCGSENLQCSHTLLTHPAIYCYICQDCNENLQVREKLPRVEYIFEGEKE